MSETTGDPTPPFGATWNPLAAEELANPQPFYDEARVVAPVFYAPVGDMWVVTRYSDVAAALSDPQRFSSENTAPSEAAAKVGMFLYPGENAVGVDPPAHQRLRAPLDPSFSAPRLAALEPGIRRRAHEIVDRMSEGKQADLVSGLASDLPLGTVIALFGGSQDHLADFRRYSDAVISFMTVRMAQEQAAVATANVTAYHQYLLGLVASKRADPGEDLVSDLVVYPSVPPFTEGELLSTLTGLVFAGHPTIRCLISSAVLMLLSERSRWQALLDDGRLIPNAVEEVLRLAAPVPTVIRRVKEDVVIGGTTIPAGSRALLVMASANRDPAHFTAPGEYRPERPFAGSQRTFGGGPHMCAGLALGRLEAQIALEVLLERLPSLRLVGGQSLRYLETIVIRGVSSLLVEWD